MAGTNTVSGSLSYSGGGSSTVYQLAVPVAGTNYVEGTLSVTTSAIAIPLGSIGTVGFMMIINLDPTNYVTVINGSGGTALVKLEPGEFALFRCASAAPYIQANTATCEVSYLAVEN